MEGKRPATGTIGRLKPFMSIMHLRIHETILLLKFFHTGDTVSLSQGDDRLISHIFEIANCRQSTRWGWVLKGLNLSPKTWGYLH